MFNYSLSNLVNPKSCTASYPNKTSCRNTKGITKKDLKDGYYNVSVNKKDIHKLGFMFDGKMYMFQRFLMGSSSSQIF